MDSEVLLAFLQNLAVFVEWVVKITLMGAATNLLVELTKLVAARKKEEES